jgi:type IV pilus assembly protein PilB
LIDKNRLGQVLLTKGVITEDILKAAMDRQQVEGAGGRKIGLILVNDFNIDHHEVFSTLAEIFAFRSISIDTTKLDSAKVKHTREVLAKFPEALKKELIFNKVLPFQLQVGARNTLIVLAADVTHKVIEKIPEMTEFKRHEVVYCQLNVLDEIIPMIVPTTNEFLDILTSSEKSLVQDDLKDEEIVQDGLIEDEMNKSLLVNLFEGCLIEAVRKKASDIHIIPNKKNCVDIFFRIDSKLILWHRQENINPESIAAVVKDRSIGVDRFERDTAQDGFAQRTVDSHVIRFRVSILPITSVEYERRYESIVIRVIDDRNVITDLKALGFQEKAENDFYKALSHSRGMVLVTGPTGSGKSTTLMAALAHVANESINVLTCEDPVEYVIKGARQVKIGNKLTFDEAMRVIVRHDPDVVLVGEIRDRITADIAMKLSNTGHLTLSTLHTNDAPSTISRLYKMGVEPFLLANTISIIIAQRLVRKLCPECRKPIGQESFKQAMHIGLTAEDLATGTIYEAGKGCKKCVNGFKGRVTICEALYFTPEIRKAILESSIEIDEAKVRAVAETQGMLSLRDSGLTRIREGITSIEEIIYNTMED